MKWIREKFIPLAIRILPDLCLLAGALCVLRALALVYPPLAWLAAGAALLFIGWLGTLRERLRRGGSS